MTGRAVGDKCHLPGAAMSRGCHRVGEPGGFGSLRLDGTGRGPVLPPWRERLDVRDHRLDLVLGEASERGHGTVGDAASEGSAEVFVRRQESGRSASELEDAGGEVTRTWTHPDRHLPTSIAPPPVAHGAVALEHVSAPEMEVGPCNRCRAGGLRPPRTAAHAVERDEHRADRHTHQECGDDRDPSGSRRVSHGACPAETRAETARSRAVAWPSCNRVWPLADPGRPPRFHPGARGHFAIRIAVPRVLKVACTAGGLSPRNSQSNRTSLPPAARLGRRPFSGVADTCLPCAS